MARSRVKCGSSGDWITPRLWGAPWFEKPALLYWMSGAGFRLGLSTELAPRLPGALLACGFLVFYWFLLRREFGERVAWIAALILGTSGFWVGYSLNGVTDIPLAATYSAAMLLAMPWVEKRDTRNLPVAAAMFGVAVLAKGLVPLALALPLLMGRHVRDWLRWRVVAPFLIVALPWYVLCYWRNGWGFLSEFIVKQHFSRVTSDALMHQRPWWFYLPLVLAALLPWSPLFGLVARRRGWEDRRRLFLGVWALTVLVLFSIPINKLPGYSSDVAGGGGADNSAWKKQATHVVAGACAGCWWRSIAAQVLPAAVLTGLTQAARPRFQAIWLAAPAMAAAAWWLEARGRRLAGVMTVAAGAALGIGYLKAAATPELDREVSARGMWRRIELQAADVCLGDVKRNWEYGLNFYSVTPLPKCAQSRAAWRVIRAPGDRIALEPNR